MYLNTSPAPEKYNLSDTSPAPEKTGKYLKTPSRRLRSIFTQFSGEAGEAGEAGEVFIYMYTHLALFLHVVVLCYFIIISQQLPALRDAEVDLVIFAAYRWN